MRLVLVLSEDSRCWVDLVARNRITTSQDKCRCQNSLLSEHEILAKPSENDKIISQKGGKP